MKRINKCIFFTLTLISSGFLPYLTINVKTKTNFSRAKTWTEDSGNIENDQYGFMFEDSKGYLWSAGSRTKLQVMYSNKDVASVITLIQANTGMTKDTTNAILPVDVGTPFDVTALK